MSIWLKVVPVNGRDVSKPDCPAPNQTDVLPSLVHPNLIHTFIELQVGCLRSFLQTCVRRKKKLFRLQFGNQTE